jgi:hypothetical protein
MKEEEVVQGLIRSMDEVDEMIRYQKVSDERYWSAKQELIESREMLREILEIDRPIEEWLITISGERFIQ